MLRKKIHTFTLTLSLAAIMPPAQSAPAREDLVIGQVAPLTGTIAGTGNEYVAGGAAYFAPVNDNGGIYGRKIRVALKDDSYKPDQTLALTRQMLAASAFPRSCLIRIRPWHRWRASFRR